MIAWIAQDRDGRYYLFNERPKKHEDENCWMPKNREWLPINEEDLPEGRRPLWKDKEPITVELTIKVL